MQIDDVRKVTLEFVKGPSSSHLIPADEVDRFVEASKRLHWKPGINPHVRDRDNRASKIWRISVAKLELRGPFWWTVPDLQNNGDPAGARIIDAGVGKTVFVDEAYVARCRAEEAEAEARHWRKRVRAATAEAQS